MRVRLSKIIFPILTLIAASPARGQDAVELALVEVATCISKQLSPLATNVNKAFENQACQKNLAEASPLKSWSVRIAISPTNDKMFDTVASKPNEKDRVVTSLFGFGLISDAPLCTSITPAKSGSQIFRDLLNGAYDDALDQVRCRKEGDPLEGLIGFVLRDGKCVRHCPKGKIFVADVAPDQIAPIEHTRSINIMDCISCTDYLQFISGRLSKRGLEAFNHTLETDNECHMANGQRYGEFSWCQIGKSYDAATQECIPDPNYCDRVKQEYLQSISWENLTEISRISAIGNCKSQDLTNLAEQYQRAFMQDLDEGYRYCKTMRPHLMESNSELDSVVDGRQIIDSTFPEWLQGRCFKNALSVSETNDLRLLPLPAFHQQIRSRQFFRPPKIN